MGGGAGCQEEICERTVAKAGVRDLRNGVLQGQEGSTIQMEGQEEHQSVTRDTGLTGLCTQRGAGLLVFQTGPARCPCAGGTPGYTLTQA